MWSFNQNLYTIIAINKILERDKAMKKIKKNIGDDIQNVCNVDKCFGEKFKYVNLSGTNPKQFEINFLTKK